eukprot:TRINITY_DN6980_c0_g1_i1.p1 TRINITY_DN6980_c0_g1~~TRINITY_DN6980_c0_g1_i1.p1  ORF type:complete len:515 (+),score=116.55 TRINITY_DN6980_c0_g1_i1:28-1572(+)
MIEDGSVDSFAQLLLCGDMIFTRALAQTTNISEAARLGQKIVTFYAYHNMSHVTRTIEVLIYDEVKNQSTAGTLFRNNSNVTHIMTCFSKFIGVEYLRSVLCPIVDFIIEEVGRGVTFEPNPDLLPQKGPGSDLDVNIANLRTIFANLMDTLLNSMRQIPVPLREIGQYLREATQEKFPESNNSVIGGFFFLRYMCPAIVAPDGFKVVAPGTVISPETRRVLVLLSKIVQTIANEREFGGKEPYMVPFNRVVKEYANALNYFTRTLSKIPPATQDMNIPIYDINFERYVEDSTFLHGQAMLKIEKIREFLEGEKLSQDRTTHHNATQILNMLDDLENLPIVVDGDDEKQADVFRRAKPQLFKHDVRKEGFLSTKRRSLSTLTVSSATKNSVKLKKVIDIIEEEEPLQNIDQELGTDELILLLESINCDLVQDDSQPSFTLINGNKKEEFIINDDPKEDHAISDNDGFDDCLKSNSREGLGASLLIRSFEDEKARRPSMFTASRKVSELRDVFEF